MKITSMLKKILLRFALLKLTKAKVNILDFLMMFSSLQI